MSYQVIARKWRPQTFEEVTGQESITRTLRNAVEHERLHHAYLFSGARGVGKTTTARLLAKALNCHKTPKPNPIPCTPSDPTACPSCREIAEGRSIDVLEIDAASNTGVDNVREVIINNINIAPARDRYKIFIIDEVHMLSNSSFNALLKTLEEPPPNVAFIMATTELHKVPDTILSRCQEFEFRTIAPNKIFDRLKLIADAEGINVDDVALKEIARSGEGSMRDAQSNFDQVISFSGEKIAIEDVAIALGLASSETLTRIIRGIAESQPREALGVVEDIIRRGHDLRNFCRDLLSFFRDLLVAKVAGDTDGLLESSLMPAEDLKTFAANFSEADLIRFFNSLSETEMQLRTAMQPRYVLEVGLVKLIEMRRVAPVEKILERLAQLESAMSGGSLPPGPPVRTEAPRGGNDFAATQAAEKKTLIIDPLPEDAPFPAKNGIADLPQSVQPVAAEAEKIPEKPTETPQEPPVDFADDFIEYDGGFPESTPSFSPENDPQPPFERETTGAASDLKSRILNDISANFIKTAPVRLPPISSEDLEHIEDNWLDSAYEDSLLRSGDNLSRISNAAEIVADLLQVNGAAVGINRNGSNGAAATAPARSPAITIDIPIYDDGDESQIVNLPENPTEDDLWRFAESHPSVKKALRIFRGKIVNVTKE